MNAKWSEAATWTSSPTSARAGQRNSFCFDYTVLLSKFGFNHSNHDIIKRTEVKRQENERAIQKLLDKDIESRKGDWEKILGLKFSVRFFILS